MFLESITIVNFRLFERLELNLNRGLNVLVGENDSGKTSIIDAIRYVLGSNSSERAYVSESDFHGDAQTFSVQLKFSDVETHAHRFVEHLSHEEYEDGDGATKRRPVFYIQLSAKKTGKERRGYPYIQTDVRSGHDGNGLHLEFEIRDFLATTYLKPLRDAEAELSSGRASRLSQILNSSKVIRDSADDILGIVADANEQLLRGGGALKRSADNIRENYLHNLIFESDKETFGVFVDIAGVRRGDLDAMPDTTKRQHLRVILEGLSLALTQDGKLHGLGYHNLLFMAAELLLLEQEVGNEFPLLLIEEPEAHLHPQLQMKLLQFIGRKVRSDDNSNGIQCLLTTHSPNLSSKADPSSVILLGDGKAWPLRPDETELDQTDYLFLRKFLDATKANVFFAKGLLFVEGDAENILLPKIAELLGRPLENYGVSIVKYDNSGSWKRFAKLFLRKNHDGEPAAWTATRVCVLRDLDLWPDCAEEKEDGTNPYGFIKAIARNQRYWRRNCDDVLQRRAELIDGLQRQNVVVRVADDWTFEFCLAKYGLFEECYEALIGSRDGIGGIAGDADAKATYIQARVAKTDFAYNLGSILEKQREDAAKAALEILRAEQRNDSDTRERAIHDANAEFATALKQRLPPYIVEAIEHVTPTINDGIPDAEEAEGAEPA